MFRKSHQNQTALLNGHEAHLWVVSTDHLPVSSDEKLFLKLSQAEQLHYNTLRMPKVRREYLITRALIRSALSYYVNLAPLEWEFVKNQYGRPRLAQRFSDLNLHFNISHSHGAVACVIACGHQVGLDIEPQDRKASFFDFAENVLSPYEQTSLNATQLNGGDPPIHFLHYWTLKEAYSKALGLGLSLPFTEIICAFSQTAYDELSSSGEFTPLPKERWQFLQTPLLSHHLLAIAIDKSTADNVAVRKMEFDPEFEAVHLGELLRNASEYPPRLMLHKCRLNF